MGGQSVIRKHGGAFTKARLGILRLLLRHYCWALRLANPKAPIRSHGEPGWEGMKVTLLEVDLSARAMKRVRLIILVLRGSERLSADGRMER
jgi:hypothetical protein